MTANQQFAPPGPWVAQGDPDPFMWVDPWAAIDRERASSQYIGWAMTNAANDPSYMQSVNAAQRQYQAPASSYGYNEQARCTPIVEIIHGDPPPEASAISGTSIIAAAYPVACIVLFIAIMTGLLR